MNDKLYRIMESMIIKLQNEEGYASPRARRLMDLESEYILKDYYAREYENEDFVVDGTIEEDCLWLDE